MKKVLLFTMAIFIFAGAYSQMENIIKSEKKTVINEPINITKDYQGSSTDQNDFQHKSVKSGDVEKVVIGMSGNIYGHLFSRSGPITYHP
ncbi:MAG: hypothetical protein K8S16_13650, partial [Bacteroidales bacterium]|nr:hypothetical protein [Bacteroidales bacterium]